SLLAFAQDKASVTEKGTLTLHLILHAIGEERYEISRDGDSLVMTAASESSDRGNKRTVGATLRMKRDLSPERFELTGRASSSVIIGGNGIATVRDGDAEHTLTPPAQFFAASGYQPFSVQMM